MRNSILNIFPYSWYLYNSITMATEFIRVNPQVEKHIAIIELNRPKELNALSRELMLEIRDTLVVVCR